MPILHLPGPINQRDEFPCADQASAWANGLEEAAIYQCKSDGCCESWCAVQSFCLQGCQKIYLWCWGWGLAQVSHRATVTRLESVVGVEWQRAQSTIRYIS